MRLIRNEMKGSLSIIVRFNYPESEAIDTNDVFKNPMFIWFYGSLSVNGFIDIP